MNIEESLKKLFEVYPYSRYNFNCSILLLKEPKRFNGFINHVPVNAGVIMEIADEISGVTAIYATSVQEQGQDVVEVFFGDRPGDYAFFSEHKLICTHPNEILENL